MTIEETIEEYIEKGDYSRDMNLISTANDYYQIAEWLKELKCVKASFVDGYEKGVKEFAKYLLNKEVEDYTDIVDLAVEFIRKEGGSNDR